MPKKKQGGADNEQEHQLLRKCQLASAILGNDLSSVQRILERSLPIGASVDAVILTKSAGEAFTGGRSTPVYFISATVHRNGKSQSRHFVVKLVMMNDDEGPKVAQLRESYAIERRFYDTIGSQLRANQLTIPKFLYSDLDGSKAWPIFCILLNDVTTTHSEHPIFLQVNQAKAALKWIASFHALFWGTHQHQKDWRLWERGGFWTKTTDTSRIGVNWLQTIRYVETKHGNALARSNLRAFGKRLQNAGTPIHEFLNRLSASTRYGTVIHGDYKAANMFLSSTTGNDGDEENDSSGVAVVDFQYTGFGLCSDDVAYLLYPDARGHFGDVDEAELIQCYHSELIEQLMSCGRGGPSTLSLEAFRMFFRLSQLEMTRHWLQKGWAASTAAEVELMLKLDSFMSDNLDQGEVKSNYDNILSNLLPSLE